MHPSVIEAFASETLLQPEDVTGKTVLEVGAGDVNGSIRPIVELHAPKSYLGVDNEPGQRVDQVVDCVDLISTFGLDQFDVVVTTEMLEHVRDWRRCVANLAGVVKPDGVLVITTRAPGFPYHAYPEDHWRFTPYVMESILEAVGFNVEECVPDPDPASPGVFARARKPRGWQIPEENDLLGCEQPSRVESRPLSILGYPHNSDGSGYYRFYLPYKHLARGCAHAVMLPEPGTKFTPDDDQVRAIDCIVGQRIMGADGVRLWDHWAPRVKLVYETDDDILRPDTSSGLSHLIDVGIQDTIRHCLRISDMVTTSTEVLAEQLRQHNPNVVVLPNFVHGDVLYIDRKKNERVTIGWAGGMSHLVDWVEPADAIRDVLTDDVDFHFLGVDYAPLLRHPHTRYTPWRIDVWEYYRNIDFDIGLAPLADTPFNSCKSHIKALEYMALGIPVIASDVPAYNEMVVDGVTGYLVSSPDQWRARLHELICDEAMRDEMGAKGREVAAEWTIQRGWKHWLKAYEEVNGWRP